MAEADESDGPSSSSRRPSPWSPTWTPSTSHYANLDAIRAAFSSSSQVRSRRGCTVLDEPKSSKRSPRSEARGTYGLESGSDLTARRLSFSGTSSTFEVVHRGRVLGRASLQVPGRHNVLNALAAVAVGLDLEMPFEPIQAALAAFTGVQRRFQIRGEAQGVLVVDDYGHHPAEIRATLAAAKAGSTGA